MREPVLVCGGTGFIGAAICRALHQSGRWAPHPIGRAGFAGARFDTVAAVVNAIPDLEATRHVAREARYRALPFVHLSSMAVYGRREGETDETAPLAPMTEYGRAKVAGEADAARAHATILRPGIVIGPTGEAWVGRIGRLLRARILGDLGAGGDGFCNLVDVEDVAAAVLAALAGPPRGGAFNLAVSDPPRWNAYLLRLARLIGAVPVARIGARAIAIENFLAGPRRLLRRGDAIPPSLARLFRQQIILASNRAARELGFAPRAWEEALVRAAPAGA